MLSCLMNVDLNYGQEVVCSTLWWSFLAIIQIHIKKNMTALNNIFIA